MSDPASRRTRLLAGLWGVLLLGCVIASAFMIIHGARFDSRVTALLPDDRQQPLVERANDRLGSQFEDRFVLLVKVPDSSVQALKTATGELAADIRRAGVVDSLRWRPADFAAGDPVATLGAVRYRLLTPGLRQQIEQGHFNDLKQQALSALVMPTGLDQHPLRDPFGLLDHWVDARLPSHFQLDHGLVTVNADGQRVAVLTGQLSGNAYELSLQQRLTGALADYEKAHADVQLLRSGLVFHAAAGARQARHEISTFGLAALIGLIGLLVLVFRSVVTLSTLLLPLLTGSILALAVTLWLFDGIHLLTLAFGTSLLGVAIDYALHLQCARAAQGMRFRLRPMLPGLLLSLISSALAYGVQVFTPMPGLRQMAFFAATGLVGAWLTVVLWLPLCRVRPSAFAEHLAAWLAQMTDRLRGRLGPKTALALTALGLTVCALWLTTNDSLRLINTSPQPMLDQEAKVERLLGRDTGTRYLLVTAPDEQRWLTRVEALSPQLDRLVAAHHLGGFDSLTDAVPSRQRQQANLERVRRLYHQALPELYQRAGLPAELAARAEARLDNPPFLSIDAWLHSQLGESDRRLWLGHVDQSHDSASAVAGMVAFSGRFDDTARARIAALADRHPGVRFVDRVTRLSDVLGELRQQIAVWVALALIALVVILVLRYRRRSWRVVAPAIGAILVVLSLYAAIGVPLNLFHQLSLLLVLGIGLDAGIFSAEHPHQRHVWLAITLSTISSLLTFGLLAFSATPVLHYIGLTALIGLAAVWWLTALVQPSAKHRRTPHD